VITSRVDIEQATKERATKQGVTTPAPYAPREGDVIERGRSRYVVVRAGADDVVCAQYTRWPFCGWGRDPATPDRMMLSEFAALVNHMGWRLLPREAKNGK
jgi:hypothetical protein